MTDRTPGAHDLDGVLAAWLDRKAPDREPPDLLERVLAETAVTSRRPAWWTPAGPLDALGLRSSAARPLALVAILALIVLAAMALLGVAGPPSRPAPLGPLLAVRAGEILLADVDGTVQRRVSTGPGVAAAAWSPDGTRLGYVDGTGGRALLVVADAHLVEIRRVELPAGAAGPFTWAPDGSRIAFGVEFGGTATIDVVEVDGSSPPRPITEPDLAATSPSWSPDGSLIAFRGGTRIDLPEIYVVAPDGSSPRQISQVGQGVDALCGLSWTPDSQSVLFDTAPTVEIFAADRDGAEADWISRPGGYGFRCPRSSPDGRLVSANGPTVAGPLSVRLYDRLRTVLGDTMVVHPFTVVANVATDRGPAVWSPDGRLLVVNGPGAESGPAPRFIVDPVGIEPTRTLFLDNAIVVGWRPNAPGEASP